MISHPRHWLPEMGLTWSLRLEQLRVSVPDVLASWQGVVANPFGWAFPQHAYT